MCSCIGDNYSCRFKGQVVKKAEFTSNNYNYTATSIIFGTGLTNTYLKRLFRLPLIPGGILDPDANIVVKVTMG